MNDGKAIEQVIARWRERQAEWARWHIQVGGASLLAEVITGLEGIAHGEGRRTLTLTRKYDWAGLRFIRGLAPRGEPELPEPPAMINLSQLHGDQPMSSSTNVTVSAVSAVAAVHSVIYLGMDVHKESIALAVLPEGAKTPTRLDPLPNDLPKLTKWLDRSRARR